MCAVNRVMRHAITRRMELLVSNISIALFVFRLKELQTRYKDTAFSPFRFSFNNAVGVEVNSSGHCFLTLLLG